ncbi:hypothetical protein MNY64_17855 (plasmid) [Moellerella wisconsensis]|uniref:Uncharacterized protein n=1 Tax=Moellerella wisconsensis TaxID=158849 RepID=A0ACD3YCW6_9GAMM|nr:hypothetical protein [Moellerella wisconsensis]UNH29313.1 hypothetical protein MNY64_17855 [Moellerella wisconsensis]UNH40987.1 hypothetical protein MNY70_18115 [Moellerella wisconsensis]
MAKQLNNNQTINLFLNLPFISGKCPSKIVYWKPANKNDHSLGQTYAAEFIDFMRAHPHLSGANLLKSILADMALTKGSKQDRTSLGFLQMVEHILVNKVVSVSSIMEMLEKTRIEDEWSKNFLTELDSLEQIEKGEARTYNRLPASNELNIPVSRLITTLQLLGWLKKSDDMPTKRSLDGGFMRLDPSRDKITWALTEKGIATIKSMIV